MVTLHTVTGNLSFYFVFTYFIQHLNLVLEKCFFRVYFVAWDRKRDRTVNGYSAFVKQQVA